MRYRILGSLEVRDADRPIPLAPAKWRMLLAVLLCDANQVVATGRLIAELWGDRPPQSVNKLLQSYVSRVRRSLGDESGQRLVTQVHGYRAHGYRLVVGPGELDAHRFDDLVGQSRRELGRGSAHTAAARLGEALELWRDVPFADVPPTPAVETETARLEALRTQARELSIEAQLRLGRHEALLGEVQSLVAEHPLREGLRSQLMLALYRAGRQADALAAYRSLHRHLAEELGIEPGPPLQQLHQRILSADSTLLSEPEQSVGQRAPDQQDIPPGHRQDAPEPAARMTAAAVPRELPHSSTSFIGRHSESLVLHKLLERGAGGAGRAGGADGQAAARGQGPVAIAVLDGIGGVGKSALAIHTAHQLADRFPDGQLYVDMHGATAGLTPLEPGEVLGRFLASLGVRQAAIPGNTDEAAAKFRSLVADRRLLVVLDNAAGVDQVRPLLPAGPGCAVLITSRGILSTLDGATHLHLGVMFHDQATALLERLIGQDRVAAEPDSADAIIEMCDGLPLALQIVGARLAARPSWPLSTLVERLRDAQGRLDEIRVGDISVRASFHASYEGICQSGNPTDQAAARAFRLLGVVPGSTISLPAAAALLDASCPRAEDALERLVDAHLLNSPAPARYQMHDLLRLFAREQVHAHQTAGEHERALDRVLRFYLAATRQAVAYLGTPPHPAHRAGGDAFADAAASPASPAVPAVPMRNRDEAQAWLDAERANLLAIVTHAATSSDAMARRAVRLTQPLQWYLYPQARVREMQILGETAVRTARRLGDRAGEASGLDSLSAVYWLHGRYDWVRQCLDSALAIWREIGDGDGERRSLCNLADALAEQELYDDAVTVQLRQLVLDREAGDRFAQLTGLGGLGRAYRGLGRTEEAMACLRESLQRARQLGDVTLEGFALHEISLVCMDQGRYQEAREHLRLAADLLDDPAAYVRWRGYAWSALFPSCLRLPLGPRTLSAPP